MISDETVRRAGAEDDMYRRLQQRVQTGDWPASSTQETGEMKNFFKVRERLSLVDGLVCYTFEGGPLRLVIPAALRQRVARSLHAAHQGVDGMVRRARDSVYWPGFEADIERSRTQCVDCDEHAPSQPREPPIMTPPPDYPFQQVVADLFEIGGNKYIVYADRLTGWLRLDVLRSASSGRLISLLRRYFSECGVPEEISVDGGTNLVSAEMRAFLDRWGVAIRQSSAGYPQSNGRAEAAVKSAKAILRTSTSASGIDSDKAIEALIQYHNTPLRDGGKSPAQLLMGRQLRGGVPVVKKHLVVNDHWTDHLQKREAEMTQKMLERAAPTH
ncbi:uncharacterized protein FJT64_009979 [Amphibalanus amphitrite]|uniref:RNA-directed DNA polymerase n=1 Tax=Amphibalanus amphitrite TaxID=1232801 RepID=A0A6A4VE78_AMPAM|nr:uncharacterized protein FJT64_009979 [Amphibalanus amphitrite]